MTDQRSGRLELIDAAERMIAENGPAVSLRQVVVEAGQRNSAAIRYHFGTRSDLVAAVIAERQSVFEPQRLLLLDRLEASGEVTARGLVETLLAPAFDHQRERAPGHHARFLEKVRDLPDVDLVGRNDWTATTLILRRLAEHIPHTPGEPAAVRAVRTRSTISIIFALLADLEREQISTPHDRDAAEQAVIDMILGCITAQTQRAVPA